MRDYTRKAKTKDSNEWVIGYHVYVDYLDKHYILVSEKTHDGFSGMLAIKQYEVDGDTICNPTGLTDKNGNKIWENDVANVHVFHERAEGHGIHVNEKGVICYDKIGMLSVAVDITDGIPCYSDILFQAEIAGIGFDIEVIGNIFDNACIDELLKR